MAPTTGNAVWNLTIPDTSPMIHYADFTRQCPIRKDGLLDCTTGSAHVSNSTVASIIINFYGTAIYLFGALGSGSGYTTQLDGETALDGQVKDKDLLASYSGLPNSLAGGDLHTLVLTVTQFKAESVLTFTGALISIDTGSPSATTKLSTYDLTKSDPALKLTPGWTKNGTYMQSGVDFSQQATLNFKGSGVMVYGFCSDTRQDAFNDDFGEVLTDQSKSGISFDVDDSSTTLQSYVTDNCLLYYNTGFSEGAHNLTYDTELNNVFLSTIQVLSVSGGANQSSVTPADGKPKSGGSSPTGPDAAGPTIGIGGIIGIVAAAVGLIIFLVIGFFVLRRRRRQAKPTNSGPDAQSLPMSQTYPDHDDSAFISHDVLPVHQHAPAQPSTGRPVPAVRVPSGTTSSAYSDASHLAVPAAQPYNSTRPRVQAVSTSYTTMPSPAEESPEDPHADPYAGMASYHADPFASAGRTVLTAEGMHTLEDPSKLRNEALRAAPVNRVGESSSGNSSSRRQSARRRTAAPSEPDVPPPVYQESAPDGI